MNNSSIYTKIYKLYECLGGWRWKPIATVPYKFSGKEFHIAAPRKALQLNEADKFQIEFKWADNLKETEAAEDFYLNGCCAPYGRLNFIYVSE